MNKVQAEKLAEEISRRFPCARIAIDTGKFDGLDGKRYSYWLVRVFNDTGGKGRKEVFEYHNHLQWRMFVHQLELFIPQQQEEVCNPTTHLPK